MAEILGKSKSNLTNDTEYTEAEMEILKAMSLKEAKERTAQLQKLRKLTSFQEAKFRRQSKIKSKAYHRIKKRQQRRETIKDFEELLAKDPEAAKEKLEQLETDRAYERAVLRHRGQNKFSKELRKFASRNPEIKAVLADHLKFHRELKEKHGDTAFSSSDEEDDTPKLTLEEIMKMAADQAAKEVAETPKEIETIEKNPWLKGAVSKLRNQKAAVREKTIVKEQTKPEFEMDSEFTKPLTKMIVEQEKAELHAAIAKAREEKKQLELQKAKLAVNEESSESEETEDEESEEEAEPPKIEEKKGKQLKRKAPEVTDYKNVKISSLFASVEEELKKATTEEPKEKKKEDAPVPTKRSKKTEKKKEQQIVNKDPEHEIDLKTFLEVNNIASSELPDNIDECLDNDDDGRVFKKSC